MTDNDLKYRYIKSTNGISSENLNKLKDLFHYQKDMKKITEIHGKVKGYERKLEETSRKLEKERSKDLRPND